MRIPKFRQGSDSRTPLTFVALAALLAAASVASAGPPVLGAIPEVIDWASIGTAIGAGGAGVLGIAFIYMIAFRLVKKLVRRVTGTV